jgi:hypothetical protein
MKTFTKAELIEHLKTSDKVVLMHGTPSHPFETFNEHSITRGPSGELSVGNNEFGIHLTGCPSWRMTTPPPPSSFRRMLRWAAS